MRFLRSLITGHESFQSAPDTLKSLGGDMSRRIICRMPLRAEAPGGIKPIVNNVYRGYTGADEFDMIVRHNTTDPIDKHISIPQRRSERPNTVIQLRSRLLGKVFSGKSGISVADHIDNDGSFGTFPFRRRILDEIARSHSP